MKIIQILWWHKPTCSPWWRWVRWGVPLTTGEGGKVFFGVFLLFFCKRIFVCENVGEGGFISTCCFFCAFDFFFRILPNMVNDHERKHTIWENIFGTFSKASINPRTSQHTPLEHTPRHPFSPPSDSWIPKQKLLVDSGSGYVPGVCYKVGKFIQVCGQFWWCRFLKGGTRFVLWCVKMEWVLYIDYGDVYNWYTVPTFRCNPFTYLGTLMILQNKPPKINFNRTNQTLVAYFLTKCTVKTSL